MLILDALKLEYVVFALKSFRWEDIDHSLVQLKTLDLVIELNHQIQADERRIQFENRSNLNTSGVANQILGMKEQRADELARRTYEIYCDVWKVQGNVKSAAFVRAVYSRAIRVIFQARTSALSSEILRQARARGSGGNLTNVRLTGLKLRMQQRENQWARRLEAEAKELEHAERQARLSASQNGLQGRSSPDRTGLGLQSSKVVLNDISGYGQFPVACAPTSSPTQQGEPDEQEHLASKTALVINTSEEIGKKRAADVVRAQEEIAQVRNQMDRDDDYYRLKSDHPSFMLFSVCDRDQELKELLLGIKGHHQRKALRFAKQVAAAYNDIKLNTIEKAWDLYNPDKKTRQNRNRNRRAKKIAKPARRSS